jgi:hypothetical protein
VAAAEPGAGGDSARVRRLTACVDRSSFGGSAASHQEVDNAAKVAGERGLCSRRRGFQ